MSIFHFDIDINPVIDYQECHITGYFELIEPSKAVVCMTSPYPGLKQEITDSDNEPLDIDFPVKGGEHPHPSLYQPPGQKRINHIGTA